MSQKIIFFPLSWKRVNTLDGNGSAGILFNRNAIASNLADAYIVMTKPLRQLVRNNAF